MEVVGKLANSNDRRMYMRKYMKWRRAKNPHEALTNIGRLAGMSPATVEACMNNQAVFDGVMKQRNEGHENFNIAGDQ